MRVLTVITVKSGDASREFQVTVDEYSDMYVAQGYTVDIPVNDKMGETSFESQGEDIVGIDEHALVGKELGDTTVSATVDGVSYDFKVHCTNPEITKDHITKTIGKTEQLTFTGTGGRGIFSSDNETVATVDEEGVIAAMPSGIGQKTMVHAQVDGKTFDVEVNVEPIPMLCSYYNKYSKDRSGEKCGYWAYNTKESCVVTKSDKWNPITDQETTPGLDKINGYEFGDGLSPLYYTSAYYSDDIIEILLLGTSQNAEVVGRGIERGIHRGDIDVEYEPKNDYGIIKIHSEGGYAHNYDYFQIFINVDGYEYSFVVDVSNAGNDNGVKIVEPESATVKNESLDVAETLRQSNDEEKIETKGVTDELKSKAYAFYLNKEWTDSLEGFDRAAQDKVIAEIMNRALDELK